ncbi:MAG TPA: hypothetical protein VEH29_02715 [Acidimicrobiales bacterium]|nr:hypothetical protein [Acidimicrobiales bacterium]
MWTAIILAFVAAVVIAAVGWLWKAPRRRVAAFIRAGRGRPFSELHAVTTARVPPTWSRVDTPEGPKMAWQCELIVTNGGNRADAAVRGEMRWHGRSDAFLTPIARLDTHQLISELGPGAAGLLILTAWSPIGEGEDPAGDQRTEIVLFDRYGGHHGTEVTFSPVPRATVAPGTCGVSSARAGRTLVCDKPSGHDGAHSVLDRTTGIASTWDDYGPGPDFVVR